MTRRAVNDESPLISAHAAIKLRVPAMPSRFVSRARLVDQLTDAGTDGVVIVHGPAGSGKTSLVADWVSTLTRPVSWLTLDERDRVSDEFWSNMINAIGRVRPSSVDALAALLRVGVSGETLSSELAVALDDGTVEPATLIVDDLHTIADQRELISVFRAMVRTPPPGLQLVILSRSVPPLSLNRAQLDGRVTTLSFEDLRFSSTESVELLGRLAPDSDESWVSYAAAHAGGWAAGLQMFAIATRSMMSAEPDEPSAIDPSTTPALQITADYLLTEAFTAEPDEVVELLREIAVVDRVNVRLARTLSRRDDADALLHRAFERDLFVTRRGQGWYELHPLVREVLVEQLDHDPPRARELHARAAQHFESDRDYRAALEHWMDAHRFRDALRLLSEVHLALYDAGHHDVVRETIQAIPVDAYATDFAASADFTWCQVLVDRNRFLDGVARLSWWALRTPVSGVLSSRLTLLESVAATVRGDWVEGGRKARQAMADLGPDWILDPYGRFGLNMVGREVALSERWHDDEEDVRRAHVELVEDPIRRISFEGIRALGEALAGQPLAAIQTVGGIRGVADVANMAILNDELRLAELVARRELGDDDGIIDALEELVASEVAPTTYVRALALAEVIAARLGRGAIESARNSLTALHDMVGHTIEGVGARTLAARCAFDVALASGDDVAAERWVAEIDDAFWQPVNRARTMLTRLDHTAGLAALDDAVPRCGRHDVVLALQRSIATPEHEEALKHATAAVEIAITWGMVRTVVAQGSAAIELVERCAWRVPGEWLDRVRRAAVSTHRDDAERGAGADRSVVHEPLTERERDVLRFLPSRLTLQEIANELYISMNTLKFHLKVIYRKLGVASRAEAAEAARRMTSIRTS